MLQVDDVIHILQEGRAAIEIPEIDRPDAGKAQTLMILGSDRRFGDKKAGIPPRSDTIILVRLDPDKEATAVMSVPRDLKVQIPGYGTDKINAAYSYGGPELMVRTVEQLTRVRIDHVVVVDFTGFTAITDALATGPDPAVTSASRALAAAHSWDTAAAAHVALYTGS